MTPERFNTIVNELLEHCTKLLGTKSAEYSTDEDKLHNFKAAAFRYNKTFEEALIGMDAKHQISIDDMIDKIKDMATDIDEDGNVRIYNYVEDMPEALPTKALLKEKFGDHINYQLLLYAIIMERIDRATESNDNASGTRS